MGVNEAELACNNISVHFLQKTLARSNSEALSQIRVGIKSALDFREAVAGG
jgi:hypothetical protein